VDRLVWATPVVIAVDVILKLPALADSNAGNPVEKLLIEGIATAAFYGAPALAADMHGGEGTAASGSRDFPNKVSLAMARFCPWTTSNTPANIATIRPSLKRRTVSLSGGAHDPPQRHGRHHSAAWKSSPSRRQINKASRAEADALIAAAAAYMQSSEYAAWAAECSARSREKEKS
jgi:hypothetical protein